MEQLIPVWVDERKQLIESIQRERDRAQAIIHACGRGVPLTWGIFLKDGQPDLEAIAFESEQRSHYSVQGA